MQPDAWRRAPGTFFFCGGSQLVATGGPPVASGNRRRRAARGYENGSPRRTSLAGVLVLCPFASFTPPQRNRPTASKSRGPVPLRGVVGHPRSGGIVGQLSLRLGKRLGIDLVE